MKRLENYKWLFLVAALLIISWQAMPDGGPCFKHGVVVSGPMTQGDTPSQVFPEITGRTVVTAAVVDSQGTDYLSQTIWIELNNNWANYGSTQVVIDYTSLNKENITYSDIAATGADILIVSCAGPYAHQYTLAEVDAIKQYVEEGHGILITYYSLEQNNSGLAPLVGLSDQTTLGTNYYPSGISYDLWDPSHPIFDKITDPYDTGVPYMNTPGIYPAPWLITTGVPIAQALAMTGSYLKEGLIITNETATYRGVYFAHYIEDQSAGSNYEDKQTFYNAMVWAGGMGDALTADTDTISASTGGTVNFMLDAGAANAGRNYLLLGSISGTSPGTPLPGGMAVLPLNWDLFTNIVIGLLNTPIFQNFLGSLDPAGTATATMTIGPVPGAAGVDMHFAFLLAYPFDFVSNPVKVSIIP